MLHVMAVKTFTFAVFAFVFVLLYPGSLRSTALPIS